MLFRSPLRIIEGRHSFVGYESISKRDQDLNDFLKKNFWKPTDFKPDKISKRDQDLNEFLKKNFEKPVDLKSESISKRDQDLNEFLKKNFEKPAALKLKGISNDKVSTVYYSIKLEASSPYSKPASEDEDDGKSVCPSDGDFPLLITLIILSN